MCTQIIIFFSWYSIVPKASNFCNNNIMVQILKDLLSNSKNIPSVSYVLVLATISYCLIVSFTAYALLFRRMFITSRGTIKVERDFLSLQQILRFRIFGQKNFSKNFMCKKLPQLKAKTHMRQSGRMGTERPLEKKLMERRLTVNNVAADMLFTFILLG